MDLLDVEPDMRLPLPAAQHKVIHLLRTGTGSLQDPALSDALDHLQPERGQTTAQLSITPPFASVKNNWSLEAKKAVS